LSSRYASAVSYELYFWTAGVAAEPGPLAERLAEEDADTLVADERILDELRHPDAETYAA